MSLRTNSVVFALVVACSLFGAWWLRAQRAEPPHATAAARERDPADARLVAPPELARASEGAEARAQAADFAAPGALDHVLHVTGARDGVPIVDAELACWSALGQRATARTDETGAALLPFRGPVLVVATAGGYCRRVLGVEADSAADELALVEAGALEIHCVDEAGAPIAGVRASLAPPDAHGARWLDEGSVFRPSSLGPTAEQRITRAESAIAATSEPVPSASFRAAGDGGDPDDAIAWGPDHAIARAFRDVCADERWNAVSDADGILRWPLLPARADYHWAPPAELAATFTPPPELPLIRATEAGLHIDETSERSPLSGPFAIGVGATTRLECRVHRHTHVRGRLPIAALDPRTRAVVKLFARSEIPTTTGRPVETEDLERTAWADGDGFEFRGVRPGRKLVRAWWQEPEQVFRFARREFELLSGEQLDLGVVAACGSHRVRGSLRLVGSDGAPLALADAFARATPPPVIVHLSSSGAPGAGADLFQQIEVGWQAPFELCDLPDGPLTLSVEWPDALEAALVPGVRVRAPRDIALALPGPRTVALDVVVERLVARRVAIELPAGATPVRLELHWIATSGASGHRDVRRVEFRAGRATLELDVPDERIAWLVHSQTLEEPDEVASWQWSGSTERGAGPALVARLERGTELLGRALDASGQARANEPVLLSSGAFGLRAARHWTHKCRTDENGNYRLRGLVPGASARVSVNDATVTTGAAGEASVLDLRW